MTDYLVVGAGPAGAACAEELRARDGDARIVMVGREPDPPYQRPYCSKGFLRGETPREETYMHPPEFWSERGIDLRTRTSVMRIDAASRSALLQGGDELTFDAALLATGANVRRLRVDGGELEGIHYLRTLGTAERLREDAAQAENVVLVGGSFIACEVAASLTQMGKRCTLLAPEALPLSVALGETAGRWVQRLLADHGVDWVGGDSLARFEGSGGRVTTVVAESGRELPAELVVIGVGVTPDVTVARSAGVRLSEEGGVRCSSILETSVPGIYAAGDICEYESVLHGRPLRVEHWETATAQGRCAAAGMTGAPEHLREVPYFWSDIADWATFEYVGPAASWDEEEVRGSTEDGDFSILYREGGRVVAGLTVGRSDDLDEARAAIAGA